MNVNDSVTKVSVVVTSDLNTNWQKYLQVALLDKNCEEDWLKDLDKFCICRRSLTTCTAVENQS